MITIKTFDNAIDAHLLKSKLESEGIPSYIFDEHIVTLNPLYSNLVGGIKLRVSDMDVDRATAIIKEVEDTQVTDDHGKMITCPRCNSSEFYESYKTIKNLKGIFAFLLSLLLAVYPFYHKTVK